MLKIAIHMIFSQSKFSGHFKFENFIFFSSKIQILEETDIQTDKQTDRQTDKQTERQPAS